MTARRHLLPVLAVLAVLASTACSGSTPGPSPSASRTGSPSPPASATPSARIVRELTGGPRPFDFPNTVSVAPDGTVWVADGCHSQVRGFDAAGEEVATLSRARGKAFDWCLTIEGRRAGLGSVEAQGEDVYVADAYNYRILRFDANLDLVASWGSKGTGDGQFRDRPFEVTVDERGERVYVVDDQPGIIDVFEPDGTFVEALVNFDDGRLVNTGAIGLDPDGTVWLADWERHRVLAITAGGEIDLEFGERGGANGLFTFPADVAVGPDGDLFVSDYVNGRIQRFHPDGTFVSAFGELGTDLSFNRPAGLDFGPDGLLYVADTGGNRIVVLEVD
jgi:sugar lactone lactonase YvrE